MKKLKSQNLIFSFCREDNLFIFPSFSDVSLEPVELQASN
jgi:hypothetical protein